MPVYLSYMVYFVEFEPKENLEFIETSLKQVTKLKKKTKKPQLTRMILHHCLGKYTLHFNLC